METVKDFKYLDGVENSQLKLYKLFIAKFNTIPNRYIIDFENKSIDFDNIDLTALQDAYPKAVIRKTIYDKDSSEEDIEYDFAIMSSHGQFDIIETSSSSMYILDESVFYEIQSTYINIYYMEGDPRALLTELISKLPMKLYEPKSTEVNLVCMNQGEYYNSSAEIDATNIDISKNYNDDFLPVYDDIKKFLDERSSGLICLSGVAGSGKTSLIRHLITNIPKNYIIITNSMAESIASPEFMSFMNANKNSVYILEDCERILVKREENSYVNAISSILNMSDGLLSDIFDVKFICTFNADITGIDSALLRKGRCYANYRFEKLCADKTKVLLNEQGIELDKYEPMTLADIYNYNQNSYETKKQSKIGL